jgi:hypothetical protein
MSEDITVNGFKIGEAHYVGGGPLVKMVSSTLNEKCQLCLFRMDSFRCDIARCYKQISKEQTLHFYFEEVKSNG